MENAAGSSRDPQAWEVATGGCPWGIHVSGWLGEVDQWGPLGTSSQGLCSVLVADMELVAKKSV